MKEAQQFLRNFTTTNKAFYLFSLALKNSKISIVQSFNNIGNNKLEAHEAEIKLSLHSVSAPKTG